MNEEPTCPTCGNEVTRPYSYFCSEKCENANTETEAKQMNANETGFTNETANTSNEVKSMQLFQTFETVTTLDYTQYPDVRTAATAYVGSFGDGVSVSELWNQETGFTLQPSGHRSFIVTRKTATDKDNHAVTITVFDEPARRSYEDPYPVLVTQHAYTFVRDAVLPSLWRVSAPSLTTYEDATYAAKGAIQTYFDACFTPSVFVFGEDTVAGSGYRKMTDANRVYSLRVRTVNDPVYGPSYAYAAINHGETVLGENHLAFPGSGTFIRQWINPDVYDLRDALMRDVYTEAEYEVIDLVCNSIPPAIGYAFRCNDDGYVSYNEDTKPATVPRKKMKYGRFLRKLVNTLNIAVTDATIETVAHRFTKAFTPLPTHIEEWSGDDILYAYHEGNYVRGITTGSLHGSCMRYGYAQDYVRWYAENPGTVSILVCVDEDRTIYGRSLLWTTPNGDRYIDRIYGNETVTAAINAFASEHGYSTRVYQSWLHMKPSETGYYPYMDSYAYFHPGLERLQAFYSVGFRSLTGTDGNYEVTGVECSQCGYTGDRDDMFTPHGDYLCEDCYGSGICESCGEYEYSTEERETVTGDYRNLCEVCADTSTCSQCGELQNDADVLQWHAELSGDVCPACYATHCEMCGDETDSTPLCNECMNATPCLHCGEPRSRFEDGAYCTVCKPRSLSMFGYSGYSSYVRLDGRYAHTQPRNDEETANAGYDVASVIRNHRAYQNRYSSRVWNETPVQLSFA
jgi:hypothetical protein